MKCAADGCQAQGTVKARLWIGGTRVLVSMCERHATEYGLDPETHDLRLTVETER